MAEQSISAFEFIIALTPQQRIEIILSTSLWFKAKKKKKKKMKKKRQEKTPTNNIFLMNSVFIFSYLLRP